MGPIEHIEAIRKMEICTSPKRKDWKEFLLKCSQAKVYHTPEWMSFLQKTFDYRPRYLFARDENGRISGMLPLFDAKGILGRGRSCSAPFSHHVGPIGPLEIRRLMIDEAVGLCRESGLSYLEIRDRVEDERFQKANSFSAFTLDLSEGLDRTAARFKKDTRRCIKRSVENGISVESTRDLRDLKDIYELSCLTKRRIGVPTYSWTFFKNMLEDLDEYLSIYIGRYKGDIVGGAIDFNFKDTVINMYSSADPSALSLMVNYGIFWKMITDAADRGIKQYCLGRASYDNKGLIDYKLKWGAEEEKLYYSYFPRDPHLLTTNRNSVKYRLGTSLVSRMPLPIYKKFSEEMLGYFG